MVEAARRSRVGGAQEAFEVWQECWDSVLFFCQYAATQWNVAVGMERPVYFGLRYEGVEAAMRMTGIRPANRAALLADLVEMERAALKVLNQIKEE